MLLRSNELFPMLFNEVLNGVNNSWSYNQARAPQINISESKLNYKIEFSIPGLSKEDLSIVIDADNTLVVSVIDKAKNAAENSDAQAAKTENPDEKYHTLRRDFHIGTFKEAINLPDNVHKDRISAKVENGILCILLPKITQEEQAQLAKTISID